MNLIERLEDTAKDLRALPRGHILYGRLVDEVEEAAAALRKYRAVYEAAKSYEEACWERNQTMFPALKKAIAGVSDE